MLPESGRVIRPEDVAVRKSAEEWPNLLIVEVESEERLGWLLRSKVMKVRTITLHYYWPLNNKL